MAKWHKVGKDPKSHVDKIASRKKSRRIGKQEPGKKRRKPAKRA